MLDQYTGRTDLLMLRPTPVLHVLWHNKLKTSIMNKMILLLIFIALSNLMYGQCKIDAGINRNICPTENTNGAMLFGEVISGDVVWVRWESEFYEPILDKTYYASTMLSDTTILQPTVEQHFERTVRYYLIGTTSTNENCIDSVELNFSDWIFLTIDKVTGKPSTDTVELWIAAESNWPHERYEWSPNYMISDTTIRNPKVWNDTTVFYNLEITDSLGCSVKDDIFEVYVTPSSTNSIDLSNLKIFPNPTSDILNIQFDNQIEKVKLLDIEGKFIIELKGNHINLSTLSDGIYILQVNLANGQLINKLVSKKTP